jgi:hypothetical protein
MSLLEPAHPAPPRSFVSKAETGGEFMRMGEEWSRDLGSDLVERIVQSPDSYSSWNYPFLDGSDSFPSIVQPPLQGF